MRKKTSISQADLDAFYDAVKGTKPIHHNKIDVHQKNILTKQTKPYKKNLEDTSCQFSETSYLPPVSGETLITHKRSGISDKILRKLRKGQYNVDAILDLHGMTVSEAKIAVDQFLQQCLQKRNRVVLIIHGKGQHSNMPILKNKLNHWLRETNTVLAFCSAASTHGSRGAMYVLLKRNPEEDIA